MSIAASAEGEEEKGRLVRYAYLLFTITEAARFTAFTHQTVSSSLLPTTERNISS